MFWKMKTLQTPFNSCMLYFFAIPILDNYIPFKLCFGVYTVFFSQQGELLCPVCVVHNLRHLCKYWEDFNQSW